MNKRARLFTIILVLVICGIFLYPTYQWYFDLPQEKIELASRSREQIREYSREKARQDYQTLQDLARTNPEESLPKEFNYLKKFAKDNYKILDIKTPSTWTAANVQEYATRSEVLAAIETNIRDELLNLKDKSTKILQLGLDLSGGMSILVQADLDSLAGRLGRTPTAEDETEAVDRAIEILNSRIDQFGVTEPQIRRQGTDQILIEIPGASDPDRVNTFLRGKGRLSFHIVDDELTAAWNQYRASYTGTGAIVDADGRPVQEGVLPMGYIVRGYYVQDSYGVDVYQRDLVITQEPGLDGIHIVNAIVGGDSFGRPVINFTLDSEGGEIFFQLTSANRDKTLAIVLEDKIKAGARINDAIRENVQMSGFNRQEAEDLAVVLRTGAMPVDLQIINLQTVGASLGEDAIQQGLRAVAIGFAAVVIFMLGYYLLAGLVADLALFLNLFIMLAILSAFQMTLTLTSIAGLILTVGMAVDANVIIFERIKEEYRLGKSAEASVKAGFSKAFWTIMDANITTFIAAVFLSQLGTGPVQGFAYTLAVGIVSSMFTALFVSRLIFDFGLETLGMKKLSISWRKR